MMRVVVGRVSLVSLGKFGCLLGVVAALLPSLLCGLFSLELAKAVRIWLEGWREMTLTLLGQEIARFDLVHLFGLDQVLVLLKTMASISRPVLVLLSLLLATFFGAFLALTAILIGLTYNLVASATGGLVVDMSSVSIKPGAEQ